MEPCSSSRGWSVNLRVMFPISLIFSLFDLFEELINASVNFSRDMPHCVGADQTWLWLNSNKNQLLSFFISFQFSQTLISNFNLFPGCVSIIAMCSSFDLKLWLHKTFSDCKIISQFYNSLLYIEISSLS